MNIKEFKENAHKMIDWIADYYENIEQYPVLSQAEPGSIFNKLPDNAPDNPEDFQEIFKDFQEIIMPGITHWQSPNYYAYFTSNTSFPSILGELLSSAIGLQCMNWLSSPAAAELEEKVMNWLRDIMGLPKDFTGVIQDTASTSTLCAILTAREVYSNYKINNAGFNNIKYRIYCSTQTHSSLDKAVKIAGIGKENLRKIPVDNEYKMKIDILEKEILNDINNGFTPLALVATIGTTSSTAVDPISDIAKICQKYKIWLHIDAAFAGSAMVLPEKRHFLYGVEFANSYVFNPHKWLFTNFDCSAYFVKDKEQLIKTFEILPEYLKTNVDNYVNNYRDWGIQLGRRFRSLKLWFVLRSYGVSGLKKTIGEHIRLANLIEQRINSHSDFELLAPVNFSLICFRFKPSNINDNNKLNKINEELMSRINKAGKIFLSHTKLDDVFTLRMVIGQTNVEERHVLDAWEFIVKCSEQVLSDVKRSVLKYGEKSLN